MAEAQDTRPMFFDVNGKELAHGAWMALYPERLPVRADVMWGTLVRTEFVGIDHRPATKNRPLLDWPLIYQTSVGARSFMWSGGLKRSICWHWLACTFALFGWFHIGGK